MAKKLMIAVVSCIAYSVLASLLLYIIGGESHRLDWGFIGTAIGILIYSGPFFLVVGIPFSYFADWFLKNQKNYYVFEALLYVISGLIVGGIVYLVFRDSLSLSLLSIYFGTAAFTLFLGFRHISRLFQKA